MKSKLDLLLLRKADIKLDILIHRYSLLSMKSKRSKYIQEVKKRIAFLYKSLKFINEEIKRISRDKNKFRRVLH